MDIKGLLRNVGGRLPFIRKVLHHNVVLQAQIDGLQQQLDWSNRLLEELRVEFHKLELDRDRLLVGLAVHRPWLQWHKRYLEMNAKHAFPMLGAEEELYLRWIAQHYYEGEGQIVDAGCFVGGSSYLLAAGLSDNKRVTDKIGRIHAYDTFLYFDVYEPMLPGTGLKDFDSFLPMFLENTESYRDLIEIHQGDILREQWDGGPIELLFVDIAKDQMINNHIIHEFFGSLIRNRSILIHQDYYSWAHYWIPITMQYLSDYFDMLESPSGCTQCFVLKECLPNELLEMDYTKSFSEDEALRLMDTCIFDHQSLKRLKLLTTKIRLLAYYERYEKAAQVAQEVRDSPDWVENHVDFLWGPLWDLAGAMRFLPRPLVFPGIVDCNKCVGQSRRYNVLKYEDMLYAVPRSLASFDVTDRSDRNKAGVVKAHAPDELRALIGEEIMDIPPEEGHIPLPLGSRNA